MLSQNDTHDPIWCAIAGHGDGTGGDVAAFRRLADLISAAGAAALVPGMAQFLDSNAIRQSRLLNRFRRVQGQNAANALKAAGVSVMAIKGLATTQSIWPEPDARAVSDADLLIAPNDLGAALGVLKGQGFAFADMPTRGPWGFVGDASFQPLIGAEDGSNVDLHIQGDAWPFERAVSAHELLGAARLDPNSGLSVPDPGHEFLIAASHATGDLMTADSIKSVVDGMLMLRHPDAVDFGRLLSCSRRGHMLKPVTVFLALLGRLGADISTAEQAGFRPTRVRGRVFDRIVRDHVMLFPGKFEVDQLMRLQTEMLLCAEPRVVAWRNWRRLTGLFRPRRGQPAVSN